LVGEADEFEGKRFPTYFKLMTGHEEKNCQINRRFRVQFETDAENDYFGRDRYPGEFVLKLNGEPTTSYVLNLWNGVASLNVSLPEDVNVGTDIHGEVIVTDGTQIEPFVNEFSRHVMPKKPTFGGGGTERPPAGNGRGDRKIPDGFSLPMITEVREEDWEKEGFDKYSALKAVYNGEEGYDFFLNIDNAFLRSEMKSLKHDSDAKLLEARFKYAILLIGLCILKDQESIVGEDEDAHGEIGTIETLVYEVTRAVAPVIIPMVDTLGGLQIEDITEENQPVMEYE
jgi:hypothetical protein